MPLALRTSSLHDQLPSLQTLLPRQDNTTNVPESIQSHSPRTALPPWAIIVIVIGTLVLLSLIALVGLRIRTHFVVKRSQNSGKFIPDLSVDEPSRGGGGGKRESVIGEAGTKIRRLIKKNRPSRLSRGMEMTTEPKTKNGGGLDMGFGFDKGRRKSHISTRLHSEDLSGGPNGVTRGPFGLHAHSQSTSRSFVGTGSALTSLGREEDVEKGRGKAFGNNMGVGAPRTSRGRPQSEDDWDYDTHSVAHTIRDSFEDPAPETSTSTAPFSTSAPASASSPFSPPTNTGSPFTPSSSYTSPFGRSPGKEEDSYLSGQQSPFVYGGRSVEGSEEGKKWGHERTFRMNRI